MDSLKIFIPEFFLVTVLLYQLINTIFLFKFTTQKIYCINEELFNQNFFIYLILFFLTLNQNFVGNFELFFSSDSSSILIKKILIFFVLFSFPAIWRSFVNQKINFYEYFIIIFLALFGSMLLLNVNDFISLYLILELQALSFYLLASFRTYSAFSSEAGLKYFIMGSIISSIFLLSCLIIFSYLGTTNFENILLLLSIPVSNFEFFLVLYVSFFFLIFVFLFKLVIAPFHFWGPDVYEGSPLASTIFFSIIPKLSLVTIFLKCLSLFLPIFNYFENALLIIGVFSIFWGAYCALFQKRLKRFIIYSSISQLGFIILALSMYKTTSFSSIYFYLFIYLLSSVLIWSFLANFYNINTTNSLWYKKQIQPSFLLSDISALFITNNLWACLLLILFFSFSGIPPLSGFLAKVFIIINLIQDQNIFISIFVILVSSISTYYYLRVIKIAFFNKKIQTFVFKKHSNFNTLLLDFEYTIVSIVLYLLILIFFYPSLLGIISQLSIINFF